MEVVFVWGGGVTLSPGGSVPSDEWFSLKLNIYSKNANKVDTIDFYNFQLNYDIAFCNVMHEMIMIFI